jgi:hypothetical protein
MKSPANQNSILRFARWASLLACVIVGLFFLNDSFFSAWMAGGPPTEYKLGWSRRSQGSLAFSLARFVAGACLLRVLGSLRQPGRLAWVLGGVATVLALAPFLVREVLIDKCLDSGGRWNSMFIECER